MAILIAHTYYQTDQRRMSRVRGDKVLGELIKMMGVRM